MRACFAILAVAAFSVPPMAAQEVSEEDAAREVLSTMSRPAGNWVTSNSEYWTTDGGEPKEYVLHFTMDPGGLSISGCMWGRTDGVSTSPFWHFFHGWDPSERAIIAWQVNPAVGTVAMGYERHVGAKTTETIQEMHSPGRPAAVVRHINEWIHADTLVSRSYGSEDGEWTPRRSYTWVWTPASDTGEC